MEFAIVLRHIQRRPLDPLQDSEQELTPTQPGPTILIFQFRLTDYILLHVLQTSMQIDGRRFYIPKMFAGRSEASEVKDGASQGRRGVATPLFVLRKQDFVRRFVLGPADAEHCWHQPCG